MGSPADLHDFAVDLLAAAEEALDTIPNLDSDLTDLSGAPERAFVSPGRPALEDCEQLTVHADTIQPADTPPGGLEAGKRFVTGQINLVTFVITIARCVVNTRGNNLTNLTEPYPAADLQATARQTNADAWALWNHLFNMAAASEPPFSLCKGVFFDAMRALPEEGGRAGWTLIIRVRLDGYSEWAFS